MFAFTHVTSIIHKIIVRPWPGDKDLQYKVRESTTIVNKIHLLNLVQVFITPTEIWGNQGLGYRHSLIYAVNVGSENTA